MSLRVINGCEESQAVTIEMRKLGIEAFSCDVLPCSGGHPEWHIQGDVLDAIRGVLGLGNLFSSLHVFNCNSEQGNG